MLRSAALTSTVCPPGPPLTAKSPVVGTEPFPVKTGLPPTKVEFPAVSTELLPVSTELLPVSIELLPVNTVLLPASKAVLPDDVIIEDGRIAGTADVEMDGTRRAVVEDVNGARQEVDGAETTVAMAEMLLVDDDNIVEDAAVDNIKDDAKDGMVEGVIIVGAIVGGVDIVVVVAAPMDIGVVVVNVIVAEIVVEGSGEANSSISGSSSASVNPMAASTTPLPVE